MRVVHRPRWDGDLRTFDHIISISQIPGFPGIVAGLDIGKKTYEGEYDDEEGQRAERHS